MLVRDYWHYFLSGRTNPLFDFLSSLNPLIWINFDKTTAPLPQLGSASEPTASVGGTTVLTENGAVFDGLTSIVTVANMLTWYPVATDYTFICIANLNNTGEGNVGALSVLNGSGSFPRFNGIGTNQLRGLPVGTTANGNSQSTADATVIGQKQAFIHTVNITTKLPGLFRCIGGIAFECGYATGPIAYTGDLRMGHTDLTIGNRNAVDWTIDGTYYNYLMLDRLMTVPEMDELALLI